ncbi:MAG TPA: SLC13 family permease [Gammaproteobacteria bacterium]|nr:SLC13 family permease [Gammaproteobacteria bacterium]
MLEILNLTMDIILVLAILGLTAILFISNAVRIDVAAILVLMCLGLFKLLPSDQLFSGLSSDAVISLIAIMIISAGLDTTGITVRVARWLLKFGGESPRKILILVMTAAAISASFMRNVGTVALFMPIVNRINTRTGISRSYLLLPMAFSAVLGGMLTMVGSGSLIVLNSVLRNAYRYTNIPHVVHYKPFSLFSVFPIGFMIVCSGIIYLFFISSKLDADPKKPIETGSTKNHFKKFYGKDGDIFEVRVPASSELAGGTVKNLELKLPPALSLICMLQDQELHFPPLRGTAIKANSLVAIMGSKEGVTEFADAYGLKVLPKLSAFAEMLHSARSGLSEAVIPPSSQLVGQEARELHMRRNYKLQVLALCRGDTVIQGEELNKVVLRAGDTLGMFSTWEALNEFQKNPDFFVLTTTFPREKTYPKKLPAALFFFCLAIGLVVFGDYSIAVGLFIGAVGMIATGVLSIDQAYEKVSWKTVFFLAGMIPLGLVMQTTGTADWIADYVIPDNIKVATWLVQSCLGIFASVLALAISNIGATVLMVPIAIDLAYNIGADPRVFALTVAMASASTFMVQSNQVNSLIAGPGGYSTRTFFVIGGGMTIIYLSVMLFGLHLVF